MMLIAKFSCIDLNSTQKIYGYVYAALFWMLNSANLLGVMGSFLSSLFGIRD